MKTLIADKCKDGWLIKIIDTRTEYSEGEVYKLARQEGMTKFTKTYKVKKAKDKIDEPETTDEVIKIFGE